MQIVPVSFEQICEHAGIIGWKEAERAWLKFRDADCDFQSQIYKGGSIYDMIYNGCLTDNINNRIKQLEQMLNDENSR